MGEADQATVQFLRGDDTHAPVLLIGGSPATAAPATVRRAACGCRAVVAIDRGLDAALAAGVAVDLFCGDGDSVSDRGAQALEEAHTAGTLAVERYNPHKDDTDLSLALRAAATRWPGTPVRVTCLSGGNPDHFLAVMGRLARAVEPGGANSSIEMIEDGFEARVLSAGARWDIVGSRGRRFSCVPLSPSAVVSEYGMRWELDRARVELLADLGISNVIESDAACVCVHEGIAAAWLFDR